MIDDRIFHMNRDVTFYLCDPSKNEKCGKDMCQNECKFTTNPEFSADGKKYKWNVNRWEFEEV